MATKQFILTVTTSQDEAALEQVLAHAADAIRESLGDSSANVGIDPAPGELLIIVAGNPFDGLVVFGGFGDPADREDWTDQNLQGEHWWYPTVVDAYSADAQVVIEGVCPPGSGAADTTRRAQPCQSVQTTKAARFPTSAVSTGSAATRPRSGGGRAAGAPSVMPTRALRALRSSLRPVLAPLRGGLRLPSGPDRAPVGQGLRPTPAQ